jgi:hypothetical protein
LIFFIFGLIRFASAQLISSPPFLLPGAASPPVNVAVPCHASFPLNQDELAASSSSSGNASSRRLASRAKIEVLNLHHHNRPPSLDRPTLTLHCYKKIISIMTTLLTTQSRLYFASSLARAPLPQSSTRRCCSLSLLCHVHHPSTQRLSR